MGTESIRVLTLNVYGPANPDWERRHPLLRTTLRELDVAINSQDFDAVEAQLAVLAELNRSFSILSTERYLRSLQAGD